MYLSQLVLNLTNKLTQKRENTVLFIPHPNCCADHYDVINYHSDNVLCLLNYMLRQPQFDGYEFTVIAYDKAKKEQYEEYCHELNSSIKVHFTFNTNPKNGWEYYHLSDYIIKNTYIFTADTFYQIPFVNKEQVICCLGYFTPFKNDYININEDEYNHEWVKNNRTYRYHITTSMLASQILCTNKGLHFSRFKALGFPRNDIFYQTQPEVKKSLSLEPGKNIEQLILYTPTFRDYENNLSEASHNLFGFESQEQDLNRIDALLEENNGILIVKLHPLQNKDVFSQNKFKRVLLYEESVGKRFNLYQVLADSDCLITDYTSTYFDYLHCDKPVIFNFYDKERYMAVRGFSFDPIESVCAGDIVTCAEEMLEALHKVFAGKDNYRKERKQIHTMINKFHDGCSAERICNLIFSDNH